MRGHGGFVLILIGTALARALLLFVAQRHVHHDEAVIGLMGKHILEGRYHPFYMYGQVYNAGAAWEAYLAAGAFRVFGVGVVPLKACIVLLSLASLCLFYRLADRLYERRTALLATLAFALAPSLLPWHFQVRGYSWYFLAIPLLALLFLSAESAPAPGSSQLFVLGCVSGLSVWSLELSLTFVAALWILLAARRKLSGEVAWAGLWGGLLGYAPALVFNVTHRFENWRGVFAGKLESAGGPSVLHPSTLATIALREMPKLFGPDTVFWYYPRTPLSGALLYMVAVAAAGATILPFLWAPSRIRRALSEGFVSASDRDLLVLALTGACLVPYLAAPFRVPGYFLGGVILLSLLTGRLIDRCVSAPSAGVRLVGAAVLAIVVCVGVGAMIELGRHPGIDTLIWTRSPGAAPPARRPARIPAEDLEAVQRHLRRNGVSTLSATMPLLYPLLFESGETLGIADPISGWERRVYPQGVAPPAPGAEAWKVFVIETDSPFRGLADARFARLTGSPPISTEYGTLTVLEAAVGPKPAISLDPGGSPP